MPYILAYTKTGEGTYDDFNYPGHTGAYQCDWEHAMHLAVSDDGMHYEALRNNTGILFPEATFTEGKPQGTTKTLLFPWIFRMENHTFGICAIRRNQNAPDPLTKGCMMLFFSDDLVNYKEAGFLKLSDREISAPACRFVPERNVYYIEWEEDGQYYGAYTSDFRGITDIRKCESCSFERAQNYGIPGAVPGNVIEVTKEEAAKIRGYFGVIQNVGVSVPQVDLRVGQTVEFTELPKVVLHYSDGSVHEKKVRWDQEAFQKIDFLKPGEYKIPGTVMAKDWKFPMALSPVPGQKKRQGNLSDPCITEHMGTYYLTGSGDNRILVRAADSIEGVFTAPPVVIYEFPKEHDDTGTWAAELHFIKGIPYVFTALCPGDWTRVQSCVLRCHGDVLNAEDWEAPQFCVKPDGTILTENGISLDMTYFCDAGVHYVMWSDRKMQNQGTEAVIAEPADLYIAVVDPDAPWKMISQPQCIRRPIYGWDRYETEVVEGPYLLRHGSDLFVSFSGSSTGMADLYDVGFLHTKTGANLLSPEAWDWMTYPFLTKESIPGQYGPGHNNFVKDPETGDDLMIFHAVLHDENGKAMGRMPGVRRVHFSANGMPYLEMTPERDLNETCRNVLLNLTITEQSVSR